MKAHHKDYTSFTALVLFALAAFGLAYEHPMNQEPHYNSMTLTSPAFSYSDLIPARYTCDAENISPPLEIGDIPPGTKSFALIVEDIDAPGGVFTHLLAWNIPAARTSLAEGDLSSSLSESEGIQKGMTSAHTVGYVGPCPPQGERHRYHFRLRALDTMLDLPVGASRADLDSATGGHILTIARHMGLYERR